MHFELYQLKFFAQLILSTIILALLMYLLFYTSVSLGDPLFLIIQIGHNFRILVVAFSCLILVVIILYMCDVLVIKWLLLKKNIRRNSKGTQTRSFFSKIITKEFENNMVALDPCLEESKWF